MSHAFCPHCGFDLEANGPASVGIFKMHTPESDLLAGNVHISFTAAERIIVHSLLMSAPKPVKRLALIERAGLDSDTNSLTVLIHRIKSRIAAAGFHAPIRTVRGLGYEWAAEITQQGEQ